MPPLLFLTSAISRNAGLVVPMFRHENDRLEVKKENEKINDSLYMVRDTRGRSVRVGELHRVVVAPQTGFALEALSLVSQKSRHVLCLHRRHLVLWQKCGGALPALPDLTFHILPSSSLFRSFSRPPVTSPSLLGCCFKCGAPLQVWGPDSGGDVIELRLKTDSATSDTDATFVKLEAYGGSLDFESTKVNFWMQHTPCSPLGSHSGT